jgi:hypothetical protein
MKTTKQLTILAAILAITSLNVNAMPGAAHDRLGAKLLSSPPPKGAQGLTFQKVQSINRWMDNPATKTGEYMNHGAGLLVHPRNHGMLRHNPDAVSRVMSGTGEIDPAIKNIARIHKIGDVAHNTSPVDGWKATREMKRGAELLVSHVDDRGSLPSKLPSWVDKTGPLSKTARTVAKSATKVTKVAPGVGIVVEGVVRGYDVYETEKEFQRGEITAHERGARHAENAGGVAGGVGGAAAGAAAGAAIGAPFGGIGAIPGAAIGGIIGGIAGGVAGDAAGTKAGRAIYDWTSN